MSKRKDCMNEIDDYIKEITYAKQSLQDGNYKVAEDILTKGLENIVKTMESVKELYE